MQKPVVCTSEPSEAATSSRHLVAMKTGRIKVRLFQGLLKLERDAILSASMYKHFLREAVVAHQDEPADSLFLLVTGSARFFFVTPYGHKVYVHWLVPGEIFGAASLLHYPTTFLVSTEVSKGAQILVWQRNAIRSLVVLYPRLLENALSVASDYLTWYLASHLSLICRNARQRLAHVLVSLANGIGHKSTAGVRLDITNEQLANTANITLFTASRLIGQFQRMGAVSKTRGHIFVRQPELLFRSAGKS